MRDDRRRFQRETTSGEVKVSTNCHTFTFKKHDQTKHSIAVECPSQIGYGFVSNILAGNRCTIKDQDSDYKMKFYMIRKQGKPIMVFTDEAFSSLPRSTAKLRTRSEYDKRRSKRTKIEADNHLEREDEANTPLHSNLISPLGVDFTVTIDKAEPGYIEQMWRSNCLFSLDFKNQQYSIEASLDRMKMISNKEMRGFLSFNEYKQEFRT